MEQRRVLTIMTVALRAGEVMLANSVSVAECDAGLRRICTSFGLPRCEVMVEMNTITLSYLASNLESAVTLVRVVDGEEPHLHRLVAVEQLIRRIESGDADLDTAWDQLEKIAAAPGPYRRWQLVLAHLLGVGGWVLFANGDGVSVAAGILAAVLILPVVSVVRRSRIPDVFVVFVGSVVVVAVPYALVWAGLEYRVNPAVLGGLYQFLPGGLLVASVNDGLSGAPLSSLARGLQATVTAVGIALGVLAAFSLADTLAVSAPQVPAGTWPPVVTVIAAGIALAGLAVAREVPPRSVAAVALLGMGVWLVSYAAPTEEWGRNLVVAVAAFVLGVGGQFLARLQRSINTVYTGIAVLVLVPGFALFWAMRLFAADEGEAGMDFVFQALTVSAAIAAGIVLGIAVGRSVPRPRPPLRFRRTRVRRRA